MNRALTLIAGLVVVAFMAGAFVFFSGQKSPAPEGETVTGTPSGSPNTTTGVSNDRSKKAVQGAYLAELAKYPGDNIKLYETSIVGDYALQVWIGDTTGGQALLKYDTAQRKWILLDGGGGQWSIGTLVSLGGVPADVAEKLLAGVPK